MPLMNFQPIILTGRTIRLEPLTKDHAPDLFETADESCFRFHGMKPREWSAEGFRQYVQDAYAFPGRIPYAIIHSETGRAIGSSSYFEVRPSNRGVEIGWTWISPPHRRTTINPESKFLMMAHAFEDQGAMRVQFKCDARNAQSRRALEKLGCTLEGVLRRHAVMPDGFIRDNCIYSVIDSEWPMVKRGLEARIAPD